MSAPARAHPAEIMADISSNNPAFDASAYSSTGHLCVAIKATQGTSYVNPRYASWVKAAHDARLAVLHYHFAAAEDYEQEAAHFLDVVSKTFHRRTDRLALDLEGVALQTLGPGAQGWLSGFEDRATAADWPEVIGYVPTWADLDLASAKYWLPSWGSTQPSGARRRVHGGTLWGWQYTDGVIDPSGGPTHAAGIGPCDLTVLAPPIVDLIRKSLKR